MTTMTAASIIATLRKQGTDLVLFRTAIAERSGESLETVDALIAAAGPSRVVDPETVAQERLRDEADAARRDPAAYRRYHHEEE